MARPLDDVPGLDEAFKQIRHNIMMDVWGTRMNPSVSRFSRSNLTADTLNELIGRLQELSTLPYLTNPYCPKQDEQGRPLAFYIQACSMTIIHPDNVDEFVRAVALAGWRAHQLSYDEFVERENQRVMENIRAGRAWGTGDPPPEPAPWVTSTIRPGAWGWGERRGDDSPRGESP